MTRHENHSGSFVMQPTGYGSADSHRRARHDSHSAFRSSPFSSPPNYDCLAGVDNSSPVWIVLISFPFGLVPLASLRPDSVFVSRCRFAWLFARFLPTKMAAVNKQCYSPLIAVVPAAIVGGPARVIYTYYANATTFLAGATVGFIARCWRGAGPTIPTLPWQAAKCSR